MDSNTRFVTFLVSEVRLYDDRTGDRSVDETACGLHVYIGATRHRKRRLDRLCEETRVQDQERVVTIVEEQTGKCSTPSAARALRTKNSYVGCRASFSLVPLI